MQLLLGLSMWIDIFLKETCLFIIYMHNIYVYIFNIWVSCLPVCLYVCVPHAFLILTEVRKGCWISWDWNYSQLWAAMWVLGIKPSWWATNDLYQLSHLSSLDLKNKSPKHMAQHIVTGRILSSLSIVLMAYYIFLTSPWAQVELSLELGVWRSLVQVRWLSLYLLQGSIFSFLLSLPKPQVMLSFPEDRLPRWGCQREFGACEKFKWISPDKPDLQIKILLWYLPKVYIASEDTSDRQTLIACVNQLLQISYNQKQNAWEKINPAINNSNFDAFWNQGETVVQVCCKVTPLLCYMRSHRVSSECWEKLELDINRWQRMKAIASGAGALGETKGEERGANVCIIFLLNLSCF